MTDNVNTPPLGSLDLRRLRTLHQVAHRGSFSQAASDLHFTQSAVSQQIATLERDLDVKLLHRSPVGLTEAGSTLCRRYESALAELAAAHAELESLRDGGAGRVRIAAPEMAVSKVLPAAAVSFTTAWPNVRIAVRPLPAAESIGLLRRGEADIAISYEYAAEPSGDVSRLRRFRLTRDQLAVALPAGHPSARHSSIDLSELRGERWIHTAGGGVSREMIVAAFDGAPFEPGVVVDGERLDAVQALVAAGVGVALVPELDRRSDLPIAYVPLEGTEWARTVYAAVLDSAASAPVSSMLDALVAAAARVGLGRPARHLRTAASPTLAAATPA